MPRTRFNIYRYAHKGLRFMLAELVERGGTTDFRSADELGRLRGDVHATFSLLRAHAQHEDAFLGPLLQLYCPHLASKVDAEHEEHELRLRELFALLVACDPYAVDAPQRGHEFNLRLSRFAGEQLVHMAEEEQLVMPALWEKVSDKTLHTVSDSLLAILGQSDHVEWLKGVLRALSRPERAALMERMRVSMPQAAFKATLDSLRSELKGAHETLARDLKLLDSHAA